MQSLKHCLAIIALVCLSTLAFAHGDEEHIMGTVSAVTATSLTVKTTAGSTTQVALTKDTKISREGAPVAVKDIKTGERVVIHAAKQENGLKANAVQLGGAAKPVEGAAPHSH